MEIKPLTPHIGAEIRGVDLSGPLSNEEFSAIHQAHLDWMVLVFRDQHLDREQHKAFGRRFGKLHVHPMNKLRSGDQEVLIVKTDKDSKYTAGNGWHTDVTCDEYPPMGSMLYITETPECGGGDTMYADMYLAYELLSDTMKDMLEGLTAVHDGALPYVGAYNAPLARRSGSIHATSIRSSPGTPETGKRLLYVNSGVHLSHKRAVGQGISRDAEPVVRAHRTDAAAYLSRRVGAEYAHVLG
ncbi:MAG: TauD/TfdA family dioxygenase [Gammaproteobacteria bacterium]|nr:TauD/TfdA family dioxygenase [Gammaproteobacteria bacterium]